MSALRHLWLAGAISVLAGGVFASVPYFKELGELPEDPDACLEYFLREDGEVEFRVSVRMPDGYTNYLYRTEVSPGRFEYTYPYQYSYPGKRDLRGDDPDMSRLFPYLMDCCDPRLEGVTRFHEFLHFSYKNGGDGRPVYCQLDSAEDRLLNESKRANKGQTPVNTSLLLEAAVFSYDSFYRKKAKFDIIYKAF